MAKSKFQPDMLADRTAAGGLTPIDFMKSMDEEPDKPREIMPSAEPDKPTSKPKVEGKPKRTPKKQGPVAEPDLPMPPSRLTKPKVQLNTNQPPEIVERTKKFAGDHNAEIQDVVGFALDEYLSRRGA
ncbi:hypothetical protein [Streptomyces sp. NPDC088196]|uniref:hypothetical protein n=1 Tax=Streptomyces sp. NPDC088196 TaxID=3154868 RepID=UPI00344F3FDB